MTYEPTSRAPHADRRDHRFEWLALMALVLVAVAGFVGYRLGTATNAPPAEGSADVGFARDMQVHHLQAVEMSLIIRDKTSHPTLRAIAYDIATSQQQQAGQMYAWLVQWGHPQTGDGPRMAWMSGQHNHARPAVSLQPTSTNRDETPIMPGMATPAQMRELQQATGVPAERLFLELMIEHHKGGVDMAEAALALAEEREVLQLAQAMATAQTAEIKQLAELLLERT